MKRLAFALLCTLAAVFSSPIFAAEPLRLGVGLFQPDREKNDAT